MSRRKQQHPKAIKDEEFDYLDPIPPLLAESASYCDINESNGPIKEKIRQTNGPYIHQFNLKATKLINNELFAMKLEPPPIERAGDDENRRSPELVNIDQNTPLEKDDDLPTTLPSRKRALAPAKKSNNDQEVDAKGQTANDRAAAEAVKNENGLYVCPLCDHVLRTSHDFTVHIRQHNPNDHSHTCRLCGKTLSSASSLDRHMLVHSGERPFKCKLCSMAFTTNGNMHRHMRTHGEESDVVKSAKEGSKTKGKRKLDGKTNGVSSKKVEIDHEDRFKCPICDKSLNTKKQFETHMETHPNDSVWCRECQRVLPDYTTMRDHNCPKKAYGEQGDAVGFQELSFVDFSAAKFSLIAKSYCENNSRRPSSAFHAFECSKCDKSFPCGSALRLHSAIHSEQRGTLCATCGCDFTTPGALQAHQLKHRMAEHCGTSPATKQDEGKENGSSIEEPEEGRKEDFLAVLQLKNRDEPKMTKLKIKREKPRESDFENMTYFVHGKPEPSTPQAPPRDAESSDFADIQSMISVTSKTPLVSGIRGSPIAATSASPLQINLSTCASPESPLAADSANASPETPSKDDSEHSSLKGSEDADTDGGAIVEGIYTCKLCNISFKKVSALKRHNRIHSQSCSSYSCSLCPYNSLDKSTLIRHLRTHNGERPFQCVICKYAFTTKANCERHVRKRHKKLSKNEIRTAMQYNPNMGDGSSSEVLPPEMNGSETVCKYCSVDFKSNRVLRHHLRSLHNSCRRKPFFCTLCKLGFSTKNNCIRHVAKQHPEMKEKLRDIVISNGHSDLSDQESVANSDDNPAPPPSSKSDKSRKSEKVWEQQCSESIDYPPPFIEKKDTEKVVPPPAKKALTVVASKSLTTDEPLNLTIRPVSYSTKKNGTSSHSGMDDLVSAANSLVSLCEILPPQEEPLDLAVHALDLSVKTSTRLMPYIPIRGPKPPSAFGLRRYPVMPFPSPPTTSTTPLRIGFRGSIMPNLGPTSSVAIPAISLLTALPPPTPLENSAILPNSNGNASNDNAFRAFKIVNDRLSPRNQRSFSCMYCSAGFTLKSNMERHIKRKHPEFARPTRSRNFIPTLSPTISKHNMPTLSNKTRDALRVVLNNKAGSSSTSSKEDTTQGPAEITEDKLTIQEESQNSEASSMDLCTISIHETATGEAVVDINERSLEEGELVIECPKECEDDEQESATDLASVSSVIDTANSQQIQQYLMNRENDEGKTDEDEDEDDEDDDYCKDKESRDTEGHPDNSDHLSSPTSSGQAKKRSSYMDSPNSVACPFCSRKFPWTSSLRRHILTHTGQKPYKCPRCPIWFTTKSNCERHLVRKHGQNSDILTRSVPERPYKCNVCPSSTFSTQGNLRKHYYLKHLTKTGSGGAMRKQLRLLHPDLEDDKCEDDFDLEDLGSDSMDYEEGVPSPGKRDSNFNNINNPNDLPFKCHLCEESFNGRADCLTHIESLHPEEHKQLIANGAITPVKLKNDLTSENNNKNSPPASNNNNSPPSFNNNNNEDEIEPKDSLTSETRKVICAFCSRRFWSAEDLRRHMRTHSGERPFACDICQRAFSLKHSMIRHRRKHFGKATATGPESSDDESPPPPKIDLTIPKPKKQVQNSLLYLMSQPDSKNPWRKSVSKNSSDSNKLSGSTDKEEEETDLIQNLLGIQDSKMIDEMLDSADSAARLLGVKKV